MAYLYLLILYDHETLLGEIYLSFSVNHSALLGAQGGMWMLDLLLSLAVGLRFSIVSYSCPAQSGNWDQNRHEMMGNDGKFDPYGFSP